MTTFFVIGGLGHPMGKAADTEWLPVEGAPRGDAPRCPVCGNYVGARPLLPVVNIELKAWGQEWGDIAFGVGDELLISERTRDIATGAGLIGFEEFLPTRVVRATARKRAMAVPPTYVAARIMRGGAVVDERRSGVVRQGPTICSFCRTAGILERHDGVYLEEGSYRGQDIFYAWGFPGVILISDRLKELFTSKGVTNFDPIPAEEYRVDFYKGMRRPQQGR